MILESLRGEYRSLWTLPYIRDVLGGASNLMVWGAEDVCSRLGLHGAVNGVSKFSPEVLSLGMQVRPGVAQRACVPSRADSRARGLARAGVL